MLNKDTQKTLTRIGKRIHEIRIKKRLTCNMLAEKADLTFKELSEIEDGEVDVKLSTLLNIAYALGHRLEIKLIKGVKA